MKMASSLLVGTASPSREIPDIFLALDILYKNAFICFFISFSPSSCTPSVHFKNIIHTLHPHVYHIFSIMKPYNMYAIPFCHHFLCKQKIYVPYVFLQIILQDSLHGKMFAFFIVQIIVFVFYKKVPVTLCAQHIQYSASLT